MTIGFTKNHDAEFLSRIKDIGTEEGSYHLINTEKYAWEDKINSIMEKSFDKDEFVNFTYMIKLKKETLTFPTRISHETFDSNTGKKSIVKVHAELMLSNIILE